MIIQVCLTDNCWNKVSWFSVLFIAKVCLQLVVDPPVLSQQIQNNF